MEETFKGFELIENNEGQTRSENKYEATLKKYKTNINDEDVKAAVSKLLTEKAAANDTEEVKKFLFNCIDLTTLKETDNDESVMNFTKKVNQLDNDYPFLKNVAAICVYPCFAEIVRATLEADNVGIACVSGGFPSSQTFMEVKIAETAMALKDGADEIDIVLPVGKYLAGDYEAVCDEIDELKEMCGDKKLKVILETGALKKAADIKKAALLSLYSGADFIKTSTGKIDVNATPEAAYVMCQTLKEYHKQTGIRKGFKAAGGINTVQDAINYYTIVKEVLGKEWLDNKYFRIGTSRLANMLLSDILGKETKLF